MQPDQLHRTSRRETAFFMALCNNNIATNIDENYLQSVAQFEKWYYNQIITYHHKGIYEVLFVLSS